MNIYLTNIISSFDRASDIYSGCLGKLVTLGYSPRESKIDWSFAAPIKDPVWD